MTKAWTSVLMESVSRDRLTRMYVSSLPLLHSGNKMLYLCHYRRAGAYRVGRTRQPHFLLLPLTKELVHVFACVRWSVCLLFTARRRNTFVGGTCALPSALLVLSSVHFTEHGLRECVTTAEQKLNCKVITKGVANILAPRVRDF